jgi:hypothetical protein
VPGTGGGDDRGPGRGDYCPFDGHGGDAGHQLAENGVALRAGGQLLGRKAARPATHIYGVKVLRFVVAASVICVLWRSGIFLVGADSAAYPITETVVMGGGVLVLVRVVTAVTRLLLACRRRARVPVGESRPLLPELWPNPEIEDLPPEV